MATLVSRMALRRALPLPHGVRSLRIGLFGGSFNPPHQGHRQLADEAQKRLGLHQVWWLVSYQNPLKAPGMMADFDTRCALTRAIATRSFDRVVTVEKLLGTGVTIDVLDAVTPFLRDQKAVWLMGADSFAGLHRWRAPIRVSRHLPIAVLARPGANLAAMTGKMAAVLRDHRLPTAHAYDLVDRPAPAWLTLPMRWNHASSTALRATPSPA